MGMRRAVLTLASVASAVLLACRRQSVLQLSLMTVAVLLACLALAEQSAEGHAGHLGGTPPAWNPQVLSGFTFDQVADIGSAGTDMEIVPSSGRLFAADQSGYVVSVDHATGDKRRVLDITSLTPGDTNGERGLHSILADPNFAENGWLYVAYTRRTMGGVAVHNRISRVTWDATSQTFPTSSEVLVRKYPSLANESANHYGFGMAFAGGKFSCSRATTPSRSSLRPTRRSAHSPSTPSTARSSGTTLTARSPLPTPITKRERAARGLSGPGDCATPPTPTSSRRPAGCGSPILATSP